MERMHDEHADIFDRFPGLREIPQPPKRLFARGTFPPEKTRLLTIVGSRSFSSYGKMACERIVTGLRGYPLSIVSGLALGIDTIAHKAALDAGLHTIAVPGSGLDETVLYPASNRALAKEIVEKGGLLLSEFEPDFKATQWSFPQRNRLMAGLADAVLVIEAKERSGTLITARMALDYNKDILAVPGSIFSDTSAGTNDLIRRGATPIRGADDVLDALGLEAHDATSHDTAHFSEEEREILEALLEPISKDELIRLDVLPHEKLHATLMLLEIKGAIKEHAGKVYRL